MSVKSTDQAGKGREPSGQVRGGIRLQESSTRQGRPRAAALRRSGAPSPLASRRSAGPRVPPAATSSPRPQSRYLPQLSPAAGPAWLSSHTRCPPSASFRPGRRLLTLPLPLPAASAPTLLPQAGKSPPPVPGSVKPSPHRPQPC